MFAICRQAYEVKNFVRTGLRADDAVSRFAKTKYGVVYKIRIMNLTKYPVRGRR